MTYDIEQYYRDVYLHNTKEAEKALLLEVKKTVSAMSLKTAVLAYDPDAATAEYKREQYTVEALHIRNGHMVAHLKRLFHRNDEMNVPIKDITFNSIPVLVRNVIAATRFPEGLRKKAETFYGKPVKAFGQTIRITGYVNRENGYRCDHYIFRLDNGNPIALKASEIKRIAAQVGDNPQPQTT